MNSHSRGKPRLLIGLGILAAAGIALSGCSSSGGSTSTPTSGTIVVQVQNGDQGVVNGFTKVFHKSYPHVVVKQQTVAQTAKGGSNIQVITGSNPPDVAIVPVNSTAYTNLATGNQLISLKDVWSNSNLQKRYGDATADALKINGTPYVISYDSSLYNIVYYNQDLFKQLGITDPSNHRISSYSELQSIVSKLKAGGKQGLAIGPADNYQTSWMVDAYLPTLTSASAMNNYLSSWQGGKTPLTAKYTDPAFVNSIKQVQTMGADKLFQDGYLAQKVAQAESLFVSGNAGMVLDGNWSAAVLNKDGIKFKYDWALLPPAGNTMKTQISTYTGNAFAIPVKSKNQALAKKYLEAVVSVEGQTSLIANGQLPVTNDVPKAKYSGLPTQVQEQLADITANGSQPGWTSVVPGSLGQQLIDPQMQEMLNGNSNPTTIAASVQKEVETMRAAAK